MERHDIEALVQKYLDGTCSPEEKQLFEQLYTRVYKAQEPILPKEDLAKVQDKIYGRLMRAKKHPNKAWRYAAIAALLLVATATALYFFGNESSRQDIAPGGNRAILTLADGRMIILDSAQSGIIVNDEDIHYNDGTKIKAASRNSSGSPLNSDIHHSASITYHSLSTPKGGQYQIILSDGTKVWLNAASTLKYPSQFSGDIREVYLEGEAYFQVAKSGNPPKAEKSQKVTDPFIVKTKNQQTTVLGTEFDINSYDTVVKTTLINGAVRIMNTAGESVSLEPNEQSIVSNKGLTKQKADIESVIAWRNGYFKFSGDLKSAMDQISRWYDVQVQFEGNTNERLALIGKIKRNKSLSELLRLIKKSRENFDYRIEGRNVIIHN